MLRVIHVELPERVVVLRDGVPRETLGPGRHRRWGFDIETIFYKVDDLLFDAPPEIRSVLPSGWFDEVELAEHERGFLYRDGLPRKFLRPGIHRFWTLDPTVHLDVVSIHDPLPELTDALAAIVPHTETLGPIADSEEDSIMLRVIQVELPQRAVLLRGGVPTEALAPGRHYRWGFNVNVIYYPVNNLRLEAPAEVRAVLPKDWFDEVEIAKHERGILYRDGVPRLYLRPGLHRYWTVDPTVRLVVLSVDEPMPELSDELVAIIPKSEYLDVVVHAHQKGLHYEQGRLVEVLDPGRYLLWQHAGKQVEVMAVDMRRTEIAIAGQELMTRDKVTLRLSLAVEYAIFDPAVAIDRTGNLRDALYTQVQLAARDYVSGVSLDQLLEGRDEMTRFLEGQTKPQAAELGATIHRVGVKDVVLPGEMKTLLNRVIEAEKEAAANVILRREETAATRSLANTAKVMAQNPVLLRLKELESLKEIAGQIGEVRVVVGSDGLEKLAVAVLLGSAQP